MNLPPYKTFPQISNERILLRKVQPLDMSDLMEISFYDALQAKTESEAQEMQDKINLDYRNGNSIHWGIVDRSTSKIVGTCGYYRGFENERGELGCILLPQFRGQGFMSAAMQLAIDFGLKNIGLQKIWAATDQNNKETIKMLTRLDFKKTSEKDNGELLFELKPF